MSKFVLLVTVFLFAVISIFNSAQCASFTFSANGTIITKAQSYNTSLLQDVSLGDPWSISFTIDDAVVDADPSTTKGLYYDAITNFSLTYSDKAFSMSDLDSVPTRAIAIRDDWDEPYDLYDQEYDGISYNVTGYYDQQQVEVLLVFEGGTNIFASDALYTGNPATLPWVLDDSFFRLRIIGMDYLIGSVDAASILVPKPVPEPATIILLGTGLLGLVGASRKKFKK